MLSSLFKKKDKTDYDWLFDYIISYLRSPLWSTPVQTFIDTYCLIFDTAEENKLQYTVVHKEFIQLVDTLLKNGLERIEVTEQQFQAAIEYGTQHNKLSTTVHHYVIDPILAVHDFTKFKAVMCRRNQQLEHEILNSVKTKKTGKITQHEYQMEKQQLSAALNISKQQHDAQLYAAQQANMNEQQELELAIALSLQSIQSAAVEVPPPPPQSTPPQLKHRSPRHTDEQKHDDDSGDVLKVLTPTAATMRNKAQSIMAGEHMGDAPSPSDDGLPASMAPINSTVASSLVRATSENAAKADTTAQPAFVVEVASTAVLDRPVSVVSPATVIVSEPQMIPSQPLLHIDTFVPPSAPSAPSSVSPNKQLPALRNATAKHTPFNPLPALTDITNKHTASTLTTPSASSATATAYVDYNIPLSNTFKHNSSSAQHSRQPSTDTVTSDTTTTQHTDNISAAELERRKQYMLEQKQKLIALKQQQRANELTVFTAEQSAAASKLATANQAALSPNTKQSDAAKQALKSKLASMIS